MDTKENTGNEKFQVTGNWDEQSKKLKAQYSQLTDADLKFDSGKEHEMIGRVGSKLNKKHEEVIDIIKKGQTENA